MKNLMTNPRSAAIVGLLLCLPMAMLFSLLVLDIEPSFGPLEPLFRPPADQPAVLSTALAFGAFVLLVVAFFITIAPIRESIRAGRGLLAHPVNLVLAMVIMAAIAWILGSFIADQYPCWVGVPNCD
jgi:hypothetical protein